MSHSFRWRDLRRRGRRCRLPARAEFGAAARIGSSEGEHRLPHLRSPYHAISNNTRPRYARLRTLVPAPFVMPAKPVEPGEPHNQYVPSFCRETHFKWQGPLACARGSENTAMIPRDLLPSRDRQGAVLATETSASYFPGNVECAAESPCRRSAISFSMSAISIGTKDDKFS